MRRLQRNYREALQQINEKIAVLAQDPDMQSKVYQLQYQVMLRKQIEKAIDELEQKQYATVQEYIENSYLDGFVGTLYDIQGQGVPLAFPINQERVAKAVQVDSKLSVPLYTALGKDLNKLKATVTDSITRGFAAGDSYEKMAKSIVDQSGIPMGRAKTIARTEGTRVHTAAQMDCLKRAKDAGADVVKQWNATLDSHTREEHRMLDGQIREIDEDFEVDGWSAQGPGEFGDPYMDCNCRCTVDQRARWATEGGGTFTKWDGDNDELLEIDANNYEDFKREYYKEIDGKYPGL